MGREQPRNAPGRNLGEVEEPREVAERRSDFERDAAERILSRAIELTDDAAGHDRSPGLSEQALIEAAEELGVEPAAVRRAASEERLGLLDEPSRRVDALVGPGVVVVTRLVDDPAAAVVERADRWVRRSGGLSRRRLSADALVADYARRPGVVTTARRSIASLRAGEDLGRVRRLRVLAHPVDDRRCILALAADLELERTATIAAGSTIAGVGSAVSLVEALTAVPWWWIGVPVSLAGGVGVLRVRARTVGEVELALDGVVARVAQGDVPAGVISDVRARLLGGITRPQQ